MRALLATLPLLLLQVGGALAQPAVAPAQGARVERAVEAAPRPSAADSSVAPAYSLRMTAEGQVVEDHAELDVSLAIRLLASGPQRVPIALPEAVLVADGVQTDAAGPTLMPAGKEGGYVCWVDGKKGGDEQTIKFRVLVPLARNGDETRLRLTPPALVPFRLKLRVPGSDWSARVPGDSVLATRIVDERTLFDVNAGRAPIDLVWWRSQGGDETGPAELEAFGAVSVDIDRARVESTAQLLVRSLNRPFDRFRVRLPRGAVLRSTSGQEYSAIESSDHRADQDGWIYEVRLERPARQASVQLVSERNEVAADQELDLAGFQVIGARRQSGQVAVLNTGNWQLAWGDQRGLERIAESELPVELRRRPTVASFSYVAQPGSLPVTLRKRIPRTAGEASYVYLVDRDQERLEGRLKYNVSGAPISEITIEWDDVDWSVEDVGPPGVVDQEQILLARRNPLVVPLKQPTLGSFEVTFRARRPRRPNQPRVNLELPRLAVDSIRATSLIVGAADNLRLTPRKDDLLGLLRQPSAAVKGLPGLQQEPFYFRSDVERQRFVADTEQLRRQVNVDAVSRVTAKDRRWLIEQRFAYQIDHESLAQLRFKLPPALGDPAQINVRLDDRELPAANLLVGATNDRERVLQVNLPIDRIGALTLAATYSLPITGRQTSRFAIPLIAPVDAAVQTWRATVAGPNGASVHVGEPWQPAAQLAGDGQRADVLESRDAIAEIAFEVESQETAAINPTVVERAWLQTWLTEAGRQDRLVMRVSTRRDQLQIQLPAGVGPKSIECQVDGQRVSVARSQEDLLRVPLKVDGNASHVIDLVYGLPGPPSYGPPLALEVATPLGVDVVRRLYWQLLLPGRRFLMADPAGFASENAWGWDNYLWRQRPLVGQREIERWVGARPDAGEAPRSQGYVFSGFEFPRAPRLAVWEQSYIVLLGAGAALLFGLLLVQLPRLRHPAILLALAIGVLSTALFWPHASILLGQAALLGIALSVLAALLRSLVRQRHVVRLPTRRSASSIVTRGSSRGPAHLASPAGSNSSTKTTISVEMAHDSNAS